MKSFKSFESNGFLPGTENVVAKILLGKPHCGYSWERSYIFKINFSAINSEITRIASKRFKGNKMRTISSDLVGFHSERFPDRKLNLPSDCLVDSVYPRHSLSTQATSDHNDQRANRWLY